VAVSVEWFHGSREPLAELFAAADDSPVQLAGYRDRGRVLVALDQGQIVGHLQLIDGTRAGVREVNSMAVTAGRRGRRVGRRLVEHAIRVCRAEGGVTVIVATAAADTGALRFYQRVGFRMLAVERDAFTPENGYPNMDLEGVPLRDRVWLSFEVE